MTLEEQARKGYKELWTEMLTTEDHFRKNDLVGSLNFLQPLCGPDFLVWAVKHLPFFMRMQPEFYHITLIEYVERRQKQILQDLLENMKSNTYICLRQPPIKDEEGTKG